jgi:hypothetical protein
MSKFRKAAIRKMKKDRPQTTKLVQGILFASCAMAHGIGAAAPDEETPPKEIRVQAKKNPGDLPYRRFYDLQQRFMSYLPAEPRLFDAVFRISFTRLYLAEQDAYESKNWAVSIVGNELDETVPLRRGGYFVVPYLETAYRENATLMFRDQSKHNYVVTAWIMRIDDSHRLTYADFDKALKQLQGVQKAIPLRYLLNFSVEKFSKYDGLKACFLEPGGAVRIDGKQVADAISGKCSVIRFDPAKASSEQIIEFDGELDIVTLIETEPYLRARG